MPTKTLGGLMAGRGGVEVLVVLDVLVLVVSFVVEVGNSDRNRVKTDDGSDATQENKGSEAFSSSSMTSPPLPSLVMVCWE